jgi:hypothetical protein
MVGKYSRGVVRDILECRDKEGTYMRSISQAVPAALAVMVLALTLGLASSLGTSSDAEAAAQPAPVAPVMVDADYCTPFTPGYFTPGIFTYSPFYYPYAQTYGGYQCTVVNCPGPLQMYQYQLVCPGPPATIEMPATSSATCASATNFTVRVFDAAGIPVSDGTTVSYQVTPFGMITGTDGTDGGEATASLTTPTKTSGQLTITVMAGNVTRTQTIDVSCSAPGTVAYGGGSAATPTTAIYAPPPMGGGGGYSGY